MDLLLAQLFAILGNFVFTLLTSTYINLSELTFFYDINLSCYQVKHPCLLLHLYPELLSCLLSKTIHMELLLPMSTFFVFVTLELQLLDPCFCPELQLIQERFIQSYYLSRTLPVFSILLTVSTCSLCTSNTQQ